ncbi:MULTISPECIES: DUF1433 domain-containing protein [Staphylococcus]|uniref:DUF1433 domain-containing protein n=1 Tax=Staphylococcus TaxID=1279 RepID=UPI00031497D2|nr:MULTISPECIES: DUF1433 domain-containing protein [Staphylococcus]ASJ94516.1 hypothetical protein CFE88_09910 [Staphylococcus epidermidis]KAB2226491.1 DUF1433 domain-containing protein [Staphylococcus epidermidis]MBF2136655.1 DUF1433 domain-containing protein [Staphylococcus epidermidis]MBF2164186.1 DUF1433 domain-containing protein [Staphylococcus epidermidis]MBF2166238.1 DUF1433 domain-containing protein [Staphylococcus epidermidis]
MFKNNKIILFAISFFIILTLIIGGFCILHENKREQYLHIQKKRIDLFFKENMNNYQNLDLTKTGKTPMGSYIIEGYINNDKSLYFSATLNKADNYQFEDTIGYSKKVGAMYKPPRSHKKFPSQIIKDKNLNENEYTANPPLIWGF